MIKTRGTMVAPTGIHAIILHLINHQVETTIILNPTRTRGKGYRMMMTAPSMGQFTSGANVTKINMVTISGPAVLPIAIRLIFHSTPIIHQEVDVLVFLLHFCQYDDISYKN